APTSVAPALFTTTSRRPALSTTTPIAVRTLSSSVTSRTRDSTPTLESIPLREAPNTRSPSEASRRAMASPIPLEAPVTSAHRPCVLFMVQEHAPTVTSSHVSSRLVVTSFSPNRTDLDESDRGVQTDISAAPVCPRCGYRRNRGRPRAGDGSRIQAGPRRGGAPHAPHTH